MWTERPVEGREQEISLVRHAAESAALGQPQHILIEGFVGTGKQRLLTEALRPFRRSLQITVDLTRENTETPAGAVREFFKRAGLRTDFTTLDEAISTARDWAQNLAGLTVVVINKAHWLDAEATQAARALFSGLDAPLLVVSAARPGVLGRTLAQRPDVTVQLGTFTPEQTRSVLEQYLPTPLGERVIDTVQQETGGVAVLVDHIGRTLSETAIGQRSLPQAIDTVSSQESPRTAALIEELLDVVAPEHHPTIDLLCAAAGPLSRDQINRVLGAEHGLDQLIPAGIVVETRPGAYALHSGILARFFSRRIESMDLASLHMRIAAVAIPDDALYHRAEAALLAPETHVSEQLLTELADAAAAAQQLGDLPTAHRHLLKAAQLQPESPILSAMLAVAVPLGHLEVLPQFAAAFEQLSPGPLRQGAITLQKLAQSDLMGAVSAVEAQYGVDYNTPGALTFARAVARVSAQLGLSGITQRAMTAKSQTVMMLADYELLLARRIAAAGPTESPALEMQRAEAVGLRAIISMWQQLEHRDPERMREALTEVSEILEGLSTIPHTEHYRAAVLAGRGARWRQLSEPVSAFKDLSAVLELEQTGSLADYARAQMANVLFGAGFWDESEQLALESAQDALLTGEDVQTMIAYSTATLIPLGRGEIERIGPMAVQLDAVRNSYGPLFSVAMDWIDGLASAMAGEHEITVQNFMRMRQEAGGWWNIGLEPVLLIARSACYSGTGHTVTPLFQALRSGDSPALEEGFQIFVDLFLRAWIARDRGDAPAALEYFAEAHDWVDAQEEISPDGTDRSAHPFQIHKAVLAIDTATTVAAFPEDLSSCRDQALADIDAVIETFSGLRCGAMLEQAHKVRKRLLRITDETPAADSSEGQGPLSSLSPREREVALLVTDGNINKEIADEIGISVRTVDFHVSNVLKKIGVASRREVRQMLRSAGVYE